MRTPSFDVLLAPGAGADRNQFALVAMADALAGIGGTVVRMDFPYRRAGRRAPDRQPVLLEAVRDEAARIGETEATPQAGAGGASRTGRDGCLFLGGRSMGGRICSIAVAEGLPATGLILVSYPLHPPGRPEKLRTEHFPSIGVPCLFVSGTRDAFGAPDELESSTRLIAGEVTHNWLEGKGHALRGCEAEVAATVRDWVSRLVRKDG